MFYHKNSVLSTLLQYYSITHTILIFMCCAQIIRVFNLNVFSKCMCAIYHTSYASFFLLILWLNFVAKTCILVQLRHFSIDKVSGEYFCLFTYKKLVGALCTVVLCFNNIYDRHRLIK